MAWVLSFWRAKVSIMSPWKAQKVEISRGNWMIFIPSVTVYAVNIASIALGKDSFKQKHKHICIKVIIMFVMTILWKNLIFNCFRVNYVVTSWKLSCFLLVFFYDFIRNTIKRPDLSMHVLSVLPVLSFGKVYCLSHYCHIRPCHSMIYIYSW